MILVFINESAILSIDKEKFDKNPISVFDIFFTSFELGLTFDFVAWFNDYILTPDVLKLNPKIIKKKLKATLKSPELLKRLTTKLFPYQYEMTPENWSTIRHRMIQEYQNKHGHAFTPFEYPEMLKYFTKYEGTITNV